MKILAASAFAIGLGLVGMSASQAMPLAPLGQAQAASGDVIHVAGGCGPGWHRGPYGGCRPMYNCPPRLAYGSVWPAVLPERLVIFGKAGIARSSPFSFPVHLPRKPSNSCYDRA